MLEGEQLPGSTRKMPAFTLAKEAVPSSAGYVNTGWVRSLMLAQVLGEGEDQLEYESAPILFHPLPAA